MKGLCLGTPAPNPPFLWQRDRILAGRRGKFRLRHPRACPEDLPASTFSWSLAAHIPSPEADPQDKPEDDVRAGMPVVRTAEPYAIAAKDEGGLT